MTAGVDGSPGLWSNPNFRKMWVGSLVSQCGSALTDVALPFIAILQLGVTSSRAALIYAAETAAFALLTLPLGVLVDRVTKRHLLLASNALSAATLAAVYLSDRAGLLAYQGLLVAAFVGGGAGVLFDVTYHSYIPNLVPQASLRAANSRLAVPGSVATVVGPSLAGVLVGRTSPEFALLIDAASFCVSALLLLRMRETAASRPARGVRLVRGIRDGLALVRGDQVLTRMLMCTVTSNTFNAARYALLPAFLLRTCHATPTEVGGVLALGGAGGVIGGFAASPLARRFGELNAMWISKALLGWMLVLIPAAGPGGLLVLAGVGSCAGSVSAVLYNIGQVTYRQSACPPALLGRLNGTVRWIVSGTMPLGAALGGLGATTLGLRPTLVIAGLGSWLAVAFVIGPIRSLTSGPEQPARTTGQGGTT